MNRASPWADIDSFIPYQGKVVVRLKTAFENLLVRVPEWTDWNAVSCRVNDSNCEHGWSDYPRGYVAIGRVQQGDRVVVEFPMKEWVVAKEIPVSPNVSPTKRKECKVTLKGNTVISISENISYPIALQQKYRAERADTRKVARFVYRDRFVWT